MPKRSHKGGRTVRRTLADGTVKTYHYPPHVARRRSRITPDSMDALIIAFQRSPEFAGLAPATKAQYGNYLKVWGRMGHVLARDVTRRTVLTLRDAVAKRRGNGAGTAFARITGAIFAWAVDRGWRDHSPAARIKALPGKTLPAWTAEQADEAERRLPPYLSRVVTLARYTGQRRGDLCGLTWAAYDGTRIRLRQGKTGADMVIPCHPELRRALDIWKAERGDVVTILRNGWGRPWKRPEHLSAAMKRHMEGIAPGLNVHGLRKLAAASLAEAGATSAQIAAITGHRTLAMVEFYTRSADQERLAGAAIARLPVRRNTNGTNSG